MLAYSFTALALVSVSVAQSSVSLFLPNFNAPTPVSASVISAVSTSSPLPSLTFYVSLIQYLAIQGPTATAYALTCGSGPSAIYCNSATLAGVTVTEGPSTFIQTILEPDVNAKKVTNTMYVSS